jgi:hypothetical protein
MYKTHTIGQYIDRHNISTLIMLHHSLSTAVLSDLCMLIPVLSIIIETEVRVDPGFNRIVPFFVVLVHVCSLSE